LPSLNTLRTFEAAARHAGFTAAAEELHVTHAAVSKQIRELEEWLGTTLFVRNGRGVALTEAGRRLGASLTEPFDRIAEAVRESSGRGEHCRFKVSVDIALASRWLVGRLPRFIARYPSIDIAIEPYDEFDCPRGGEADLAIRFGSGDWADAETIVLSEVWEFAVCSPRLMAERPSWRLEDIGDYSLLFDRKEWWFEWLIKAGIQDAREWRGVYLKHLAYEAAEAGQGFALADQVVATDALLEGKLVLPFDFETKTARNYFIVRPKGAKETGPARAFREWLTSELHETLEAFRTIKPAA
jgi:LysR family glycine cleavage system transcriptional activator